MITCNTCIMNSTCLGINFDKSGRCNFCKDFEIKNNFELINRDKNSLNSLISKIKDYRKKNNNDYDCIVGLSGGIDSSYTLVKAVECGLRPLAVHLDNGWNSELAQNNIEKLIKELNVDFYTHVVRWTEFKGLMQSLFDADVIDIELLTDNAMLAINYQMAKKFRTPFILAGTNSSTEGMKMPKNMNWFKFDKKNILSINSKFTNTKISTYPIMGIFDLIRYIAYDRIKWINFLDFFEYNKYSAEDELSQKFQFKKYKNKHYESVFTRFYQGYLLPKKFNVDKRILHLSTLIISEQISRNEAIEEISKSPYPSDELLEEDINYFLKKMNWEKEQLEVYLNRAPRSHKEYPNNYLLFNFLLKIFKLIT